MRASPLDRRKAWLPFLAYLAFVVYGSLVPFDYHGLPLEEAIGRFRNIQYLKLGVVSRADWVANIVLYVPLAFLGCAAVVGLRSRDALRHGVMLLVFLGCLAVAMGIEFIQIFFAPRTVSLNDLWAEGLGTLLGIAVFAFGRWRIVGLLEAIVQGGRRSVVAAMWAYLLGYLVLSLFPYDFVISSAELAAKLQSGNLGWLVAGECSLGLRCLARWVGEAAIIAPLGVLVVLVSPGLGNRRLFWWGATLGLSLELIQIFLASGISQGISVPLRGLGLVAGAEVGRLLLRRGPEPVAYLIRRATPYAVLPYFLALAVLGGWFQGHWLGLGAGLARLPEVRFLPFYYHYFTTETVAMASVLAQAGMYAPVGLAVWAWSFRAYRARRGSPWRAARWAAGLALPIEFGKLVTPSRHPDPTNLLIVAGSAAFVFSLAAWMEKILREGKPEDRRRRHFVAAVTGNPAPGAGPAPQGAVAATFAPHPQTFEPPIPARPAPAAPATPHPPPPDPTPGGGSSPRRRRSSRRGDEGKSPDSAAPGPVHSGGIAVHPVGLLAGCAAAFAAFAGIWAYPLGTAWLVVGLLAYAGLLRYWPLAWAFAVPALLPALDLGAHTGRLALDEFDLVVLVTFAMGYPGTLGIKPLPWPDRALPWALALLWASGVLATARGLWPLLDGGEGMAVSAHSPLAAWGIGKGLLWALLLVPLMRRLPPQGAADARRLMLGGFLAGLGMVVLDLLHDRHVFTGLGDFENQFRVTGPFSSMNTGGGYIEAFLAFGFPMLAAAVLLAGRWMLKAAGVAAAGLVSYAMMVTFSRGGYAGLAAGLVPLACALLRQPTGFAYRRWLVLGGLLGASIAAAVPVLTGGFAQSRMSVVGQDLSVREAHWKRTLGLMDDGLLAPLVGMGFGRYPVLHLLRQDGASAPGTYSVLRANGNSYLRLGAGETLFMDQFVDVEPDAHYVLSLRVRKPAGAAASLEVSLCEKALLYSFDCVKPGLPREKTGEGWSRIAVAVDSAQLGRGGHWPHRPVKLSLDNAGTGGPVDVDDVSLKSGDGHELVANGGFEEGDARWLFVTDEHLSWHVKQQILDIYFSQGLLGLAGFALLLLAVARVLGPALWKGDLRAAAFAGALVAFLTVGLVSNTADTGRMAMLFYLGALAAVLLTPAAGAGRGCRPRVPVAGNPPPGAGNSRTGGGRRGAPGLTKPRSAPVSR